MKIALSLVALIAAMPAFAEGTRQLDAHEHGVGTLDIAIEGADVVMEFHAPGADIVGFEYAASSDADLAAIDAAIAALSTPLALFETPEAAGCTVKAAHAELESEAAHEDHDEEDHDNHDEHDHDEKKHADHEDHAEHAEDKHDDHDTHDHDTHEDHDAHAEDAGHTEFHAEYLLTCATPEALNEITFTYFNTFENAKEVEVQLISGAGAQAFEVTRDTPVLNLGG